MEIAEQFYLETQKSVLGRSISHNIMITLKINMMTNQNYYSQARIV